MKENKYDDPQFFEKYSHMARSAQGLEGAGEWYALQKMLPDFSGKRVLDLGCGFGWHCRYAADHGAAAVIGVDLSEKMLEKARADTFDGRIHYVRGAMEEVDFPPASFEAVLSSLALHYVEELGPVFRRVWDWLAPGGDFVFSCEHPVFTAEGSRGVVPRPRRCAPPLACGPILHRGPPHRPLPGLRCGQIPPHPDHLCPDPAGDRVCPQGTGGAEARFPADGRARHGQRAAPAHDVAPVCP